MFDFSRDMISVLPPRTSEGVYFIPFVPARDLSSRLIFLTLTTMFFFDKKYRRPWVRESVRSQLETEICPIFVSAGSCYVFVPFRHDDFKGKIDIGAVLEGLKVCRYLSRSRDKCKIYVEHPGEALPYYHLEEISGIIEKELKGFDYLVVAPVKATQRNLTLKKYRRSFSAPKKRKLI